MEGTDEIRLPTTNRPRTVSIPTTYWIQVMHSGYTTHKSVLFGTVLTFGMIVFTVVLLVPILLTHSKYTTTPRSTTANTTITTTTSSTTSSTSSSTTSTVTIAEGQLALESIDGIIHGVYNTSVGGDSFASTSGSNIGNYPANEWPGNACDNNTLTKYLNFGDCSEIQWLERCGLNTGFYLELLQGVVLVTGIRVCTAGDYPERDPLVISLEGSQLSGTALTFGSSWSLIYRGSTGLTVNPGRGICDTIQRFNNSVPYKSYRFLVSEKRAISNSVQYAEAQLFT